MGAMVEAARGTDLAVTAVRDIGPDYAITLRAWREAWGKRRRDVLALGYSDKFWLKVSSVLLYDMCVKSVVAQVSQPFGVAGCHKFWLKVIRALLRHWHRQAAAAGPANHWLYKGWYQRHARCFVPAVS